MYLPPFINKQLSHVSKKLYVGNLSYDTTDESLREFFSKVGTVEEATVLKDQVSGRSRGFGFVTYATTEMAQKAIEAFNGKDVDGRAIRVDFARPSEKRENSHA